MFAPLLFLIAVAAALDFINQQAPDLDFHMESQWLTNGQFPQIDSHGTPIANVSKAISQSGLARVSIQFQDFSIARFNIHPDDNGQIKMVEYVSSPFGLRSNDDLRGDLGIARKQGQQIVSWLSNHESTSVSSSEDLVTQAVKGGASDAWIPRGNWAGAQIAVVENGQVSNDVTKFDDIHQGDIIYAGHDAYIVAEDGQLNSLSVYFSSNGKITKSSVDIGSKCQQQCRVFRTIKDDWVKQIEALFPVY